MSGRHTTAAGVRRSTAVLLTGAIALGLWFGLRAPDISPVAAPVTATVQPAVQPTVPPAQPHQQADGRPPRGGR